MEGLLREHFGLPTWSPEVAQVPAQLTARLQVVKNTTDESQKESPRVPKRITKEPARYQKTPKCTILEGAAANLASTTQKYTHKGTHKRTVTHTTCTHTHTQKH